MRRRSLFPNSDIISEFSKLVLILDSRMSLPIPSVVCKLLEMLEEVDGLKIGRNRVESTRWGIR